MTIVDAKEIFIGTHVYLYICRSLVSYGKLETILILIVVIIIIIIIIISNYNKDNKDFGHEAGD